MQCLTKFPVYVNEGHKYDVMGVMKMDDENIVELFWQRSEKALSKTRIKYARYCYAIAFRILHNSEDAEECVNDTLLRVWDAIPPARPNMLRIFLGKITRNLSLNYSDKMNAQKRGGGVAELLLSELEECVPSGNSSPEDLLDEQYALDVINRFLQETSASKRKVFVRRYWYGSSIKEIGEDFGFSESKVSTILFRLRRDLKNTLEKEGVSL